MANRRLHVTESGAARAAIYTAYTVGTGGLAWTLGTTYAPWAGWLALIAAAVFAGSAMVWLCQQPADAVPPVKGPPAQLGVRTSASYARPQLGELDDDEDDGPPRYPA